MRQLVEFGQNDGGTILLEVHETASVTWPVTRTRRHSPAHGGTIARIGM